ncbi:hypothetical protein PIB30_052438 [Stylosanthes scabra]|uniref:F-box protein n=1 Tax=Stylosanthes scabra TaxID=79078 RepID=A0ABU6VJ48_9FABA|nr:hypothetical protein [Stylosanthes scabra]
MASAYYSIQTSSSSPLLSCHASNRVNAAINVPKLPKINFSSSLPNIPTKLNVDDFRFVDTATPLLQKNFNNNNNQLQQQQQNQHSNNKALVELYAILEAVSDRIEMHQNVGDQRDNWNTLLLNSINMITLAATTMSAVAATTEPLLALKLSSALLFSAATGMLLIMNKLQPSQLTEEQRNATRYFKQIKSEILTKLALGNASDEDVKSAMEKVLALDKAFPLPLLGVMLEKFPSKFEPAVWWPSTQNSGGFFKQLESSIESTLEESDVERRENGQVFEMKVAMKLGRSVSQLRELSLKSVSSRMEGISVDEFASKLF